MAPRSRKFCFTWNNYPDDHGAILDALGYQYLIYGYEEAPTTGTPHLQGFVYFENARSRDRLRNELAGCSIEIANGTPEQNIDYCTKDEQYLEFGERPVTQAEKGTGEIARYESARDAAKNGNLDDIPADIFVRCYSTLRRIELDYMPRVQPGPGVCGTWIHGLSGSGKTHAVYTAYPDLYQKPRNTWWDGYQREEVVLVDDVDVYDVRLGGQLKHWADFAPFIAERKGGGFRIRPGKVIVTSQYTIERIWEDPETREALNRRFTVIEKIQGQGIII